MKQDNTHIINCYDKTAEAYATKFIDELSHKHLDRILLKSFASENKDRGSCIDLGCGPGQTTKYLSENGITDLLGIDISPVMIATAKKLNPLLTFEENDILQLTYADASFGSAVAFYAIVHFDYEQVQSAFHEIARILTTKGQFLFSFHIGDSAIRVDNFLDQQVSIDFYFFDTTKIIDLLLKNGFDIIDVIERKPYKDLEFQSQRAYIWVRKK